MKGVAVRGINIGDVRALQVPIPSRGEQDEIVRRVDVLFAFADRMEARSTAAGRQVDRRTPALLEKAFRGALVPPYPDDEPASLLLERIRAARAHTPSSNRKRRPTLTTLPRVSREKAAMTKSRHDDDVKNKPYLATLLRTVGGSGEVEDLFRLATLPVEDFYKQLVWEVDNGHIRDGKKVLEAA